MYRSAILYHCQKIYNKCKKIDIWNLQIIRVILGNRRVLKIMTKIIIHMVFILNILIFIISCLLLYCYY